jgi:hypothetical protein
LESLVSLWTGQAGLTGESLRALRTRLARNALISRATLRPYCAVNSVDPIAAVEAISSIGAVKPCNPVGTG